MCTTELTAKIRELKELKQMQEDLSAEIETIQDTIKAEMTAREVDTLQVDVFKVTWKPVVSNRFDSTSFKATHADLYNQYTKKTESRRFTIA